MTTYPDVGELQRQTIEQLRVNSPARRRNPGAARTWSDNEIIDEFRRLIAEPDPGAMRIATDLLEETGKTLPWVSHEIWREDEIARNGVGSIAAGALHTLETHNTKLYRAGFFPLAMDFTDLSVLWSIVTVHHIDRRVVEYLPMLFIAYRTAQWTETTGGPSMPIAEGFRRASRTVVDRLVEQAPDFMPPAAASARGALDLVNEITRTAWHTACALKRLLHESPKTPDMPKSEVDHVLEEIRFYESGDDPGPALLSGPVATGGMRENPPWVTHALADAFESLSSQIPPAYLPKLDDVHGGPKGTLVAQLKEYGCGVYGCVLPTLDERVVLKVTTDDTESQFASQLAADLVAPICVEYYMAVSLAQKHQGRPIFLLWREAADDVGDIDKVAGQAAENALAEQHKAAQVAYLAIRKHEDATRALLEWEVTCEKMVKVKELRSLAKGMLEVYRKQKIFFGDIHAGNLGRVFRGGDQGMWVITDPGHVAVLT